MALMDFFRNMTEEQKKKVLACGTVEDLLALAEAEGMEMTEEQIEAAAGMDPRVLFSRGEGVLHQCGVYYSITGLHDS